MPWSRSTKILMTDVLAALKEGHLDQFMEQRLIGRHDFEENVQVYMRYDDYDKSLVFWQVYEYPLDKEWQSKPFSTFDWEYILFGGADEETEDEESKG